MKKAFMPVFAVLLCLIFQACASSKFVLTGSQYPPYTGVVKVFFSPPQDIQYDEIGLVSSSGGMIHEWTHLIEAMQKKASKKGANAIIIIAGERPNMGMISGTHQFGVFGHQGTQKSMTAIAIRIKD